MAEAETPKRPSWFWAVVVIVVLVFAAGAASAPSVVECANSRDGFQTCMAGKLADLGIGARPETPVAQSDEAAVATAETPATATAPEAVATVSAPDFGVRVEPDGSIVIVGSGMTGKTVQIFVDGQLYGTADVDPSGDWVLVPDAPLPPGGYELTVVDPETGEPLDKAFAVAINADKTSEPLVVASELGKASQVLQGLGSPAAVVASAESPEPAVEPAADEPAVESAGDEPAAEPAAETAAADTTPAEPVAVATADQAQDAVEIINQAATAPADAEVLAVTPPAIAEPDGEQAEAQPAEPVEPATETEVATAEPAAPAEDVVDTADELQKRIDALGASTPPTIDAVEIDSGKNFFAGTGANGTIVRIYVDNVFVGDAEVENGRWLLETGDVLKNRSQRVRADQLLPGSAQVASRAEIDFIFEAPAATPSETAVAEAPITVPAPDFGIDTDTPAEVSVAPEPADAAPVEQTPAETQQATAPVVVPAPDFGIDTSKPAEVPVAPVASETALPGTSTDVATAEPAASGASAESAEAAATNAGPNVSSASGEGTAEGAAVSVPQPDFSIDTGIPVIVVAEAAPDASTNSAAEPAEPTEPQAPASEPAVSQPPEPEPSAEPVAVAPSPAAESQVPQLVASPVGAPELGRFATGKAIIRSGDNLWTIARRVYGSGIKYTQIYGANSDQIRNPNLIYPGQVFNLPEGETETASK